MYKIVRGEYNNNSPAFCNRRTGVIYINEPKFLPLTNTQRLFVLLHEAGHIELNTTNELEADQYAFTNFVKLGYPLSESIYALSRVLTGTTAEHFERVQTQIKRAKQLDIMNNYNENFLGLGKKAQARKAARNDSKNAARAVNAQANLELAKLGVSNKALGKANTTALVGGIAGAATSIVGGIAGGGAAASEAGAAVANAFGNANSRNITPEQLASQGGTYYNTKEANTTEQSFFAKNKMVLIIAAVAVVLVAGFFLYKKFKKK